MPPTIEGRTLTIPAGRTLYQAGERATHAIVIHEGIVKLYAETLAPTPNADHANQRLHDLASPGDIIGLHHEHHPHTAITASPALVTITEPKYLLKHGAGEMLLRYITHHQHRTDARFRQQEYPVPIRLGELLLDLAHRFPHAHEPHHSTELPLTQHELADLIHSSRVTVTRYSNDLQKHHAIIGSHGRYQIHTPGVHAYLEEQAKRAIL